MNASRMKRQFLAACAALSLVGVRSAWGAYDLTIYDWVGKGDNTLASTPANWQGNAVPTLKWRFAAGAYGKTVTFDQVYTVGNGSVWMGTNDPGEFYDPETGKTNPVVWEATDPKFGFKNTGDGIKVADAADQNAALLVKSGTYSTTTKFWIAGGNGGSAWVGVEGGTVSADGDLIMAYKNATDVAQLLVGGGDSPATFTVGGDSFVGQAGKATLDVGGAGVFTAKNQLLIGAAAGSQGVVKVHDGGRLEAGYVQGGAGTSELIVDGGTLAAGTADFFRDPAVTYKIGPNGMTFDTGSATVSAGEFPVKPENAEGALTKTGSGTLKLGSLPAYEMNVAQGTLATPGVRAPYLADKLVHRWTFNNTLEDEVGGQTATAINATLANNTVSTKGGANGTSYIELGANALPKSGSVTVEFWAKRDINSTTKNQWYLFDVGSATNDRLSFVPRTDDLNSTEIAIENGGKASGNKKLSPQGKMDVGTMYHIAIVLEKAASGGTKVTAYMQDATTGATLRSVSWDTDPLSSFWNITQEHCWLGRSPVAYNVEDAVATYDEVRVWNVALTEEELERNAQLGPDALPWTAAAGNVLPEKPSLTRVGNKNLTHRWTFNNTLEDEIGGQTATAINATLANNTVSTKGGANGTSYIELGANALPKSGSVTVEFWAKRDINSTTKNQWYLFDVGSATDDRLSFVPRNDSLNSTEIAIENGGKASGNKKLSPQGKMDVGTMYHIAIVLEKAASGGTKVTAYMQDATTGATLRSVSWDTDPLSSFWNITQEHCWLGRSPVAYNIEDAVATYDEVRVWNAALTKEDLELNAKLGPDVLPEDHYQTLVDNNYLTHRWTFNSTLEDEVGGQDATAKNANLSAKTVSVTGGSTWGTSYVELGANALPKSGPVTVEFWASRDDNIAQSYLFDVGKSTDSEAITDDRLSFVPRNSSTQIAIVNGGYNPGNQTLAPSGVMTLGTIYHVAIVLVPASNGGTTVTAYLQDATTGETLKTVSWDTTSACSFWNITQNHCWLGRSSFNREDAAATYDEVRVWNAALSEAQLARNALLGPDALPRINPDYRQPDPAPVVEALNLAAGATLDCGGGLLALSSVSGAGTVRNGAAVFSGVLSPGGDGAVGTLALNADAKVTGTVRLDEGDMIVCDGELDLSQASLEFVTEAYAGVFATSAKEGGITAPAEAPTGCSVSVSKDGRTARIVGPAIPLPEGYTELDWIESHGGQWIDTGVKAYGNTKVVMDCTYVQTKAFSEFFGSQVSNHNPPALSFSVYLRSSGHVTSALNYGATGDWMCDARHQPVPGTHYLAVLDAPNKLFTFSIVNDDGTTTEVSRGEREVAPTGETLDSITLCCERNNGNMLTTRCSHLRIYSVTITEGGVPVRTLVPCRNPAGEAGLWDEAEGGFYGNESGTGKLTGSDDAAGDSAYATVEDGVCTVGGTGKLTALPDSIDRNSFTSAVVGDGITEVGDRFFKKCRKLNTVSLGKDVATVGANAFYLCLSLEQITIANPDFDVNTLKDSIIYQTAIKPNGSLYTIPSISVPGWEEILYGTTDLANPVWQPVDKDVKMEESGYNFFKFVFEKVQQ